MLSTWHGYGDFKDLPERTASDKLLHDKASIIAKNSKFDGYHRGFTSMVYNFFKQKSSGGGIKSENMLNLELPKDLHKQIIKKSLKNEKYTHLS